jgi:hypothetical protein
MLPGETQEDGGGIFIVAASEVRCEKPGRHLIKVKYLTIIY